MSGATGLLAVPQTHRCLVFKQDDPVGIIEITVYGADKTPPEFIRILTDDPKDENGWGDKGWIARCIGDADTGWQYQIVEVDSGLRVCAWDLKAADEP